MKLFYLSLIFLLTSTLHTEAGECEFRLRTFYHETFDRLIDHGVPGTQAPLLARIKEHSELIPPSRWLIEPGSFAKDFSLEISMNARFLREYEAWREQLKQSSHFTQEELAEIDINTYTRAVIQDGKFNTTEIFNLSLLYDNLYGSHLYEMFGVDIGHIGDFLSVRRELALIQSTFIANIRMKSSKKMAKQLTPEQQEARRAERVPLPMDKRVKFAKAISNYLLFFFPKLKRLTSDIFDSVEPSTPIEPIGTHLAKHYIEQDWMPGLLRAFRIRLKEHEKTLETSPAQNLLNKSLWDLALQTSQGEIHRAVALVGLMGIQRKALIRTLSRHYAKAGVFKDYAEALKDTVEIYYLITDLAETVDKIKAERGELKERYQFAYPGEANTEDNNKFYHYWSEVFFSWHLSSLGYSPGYVRFGLRNVGRVYELMTSWSGTKGFRQMGMSWRDAWRAIRLWSDIRLHRTGVERGLLLWHQQNDLIRR